jgi:error-prone DNA polymerase
MAWSNPPIPWHQLERTLSGFGSVTPMGEAGDGRARSLVSSKRAPYVAPTAPPCALKLQFS